jgi:hypothetical protein
MDVTIFGIDSAKNVFCAVRGRSQGASRTAQSRSNPRAVAHMVTTCLPFLSGA